MGGENEKTFLDSTEFIQLNETVGMPGPKLPYAIKNMCAVKVSEDEIFVIGGETGFNTNPTDFVWIFNPQDEFTYTEGPKLPYAKWNPQCGLMKDETHSYIVVAGGKGSPGADESVEILNLTSSEWITGMQKCRKIHGSLSFSVFKLDFHALFTGPQLPFKLMNSAMISSPDNKGVILMGGGNFGGDYRDDILELRVGANSWNIIGKLKTPRSAHVAIPIPKWP